MYGDKNGDDQFAVKIQDVDVIPESHYNLIRIAKLMEEGTRWLEPRRMVCLSKREDWSLSLTSESKLLRGYCGVHTFDDLKIMEKSLHE